ncbi:MAG: hypothetical protein ACRCUT_12285, partial [Spirochaetota bacterium]
MEKLRGNSIKKKLHDALKHGRFREASLLADTIVPQSADVQLLVLASMSYFAADRFAESDEFLRRAKRDDDSYCAVYEFESFIKLKSASSRDEAAVAYITLCDRFPRERRYEKILKKIRSSDDFALFQKRSSLADLVRPADLKIKTNSRQRRRYGYSGAFRYFVLTAAVSAASAAIISGAYFGIRYFPDKAVSGGKNRGFLDTVSLDNSSYPLIDRISGEKKAYFYYDENQLREEFDAAKKLLKEEKFNESRMVINRIALSNANIAVKEKAAFLVKFFPPDERISPMNLPVSELLSHRALYDGVVMACEGRAANVEKRDGK